MNDAERASKLSWYRRKSGKYEVKERPKSWHVLQVGSYRPLNVTEKEFRIALHGTKRLSKPPTPPVRSSTTRLQTVQYPMKNNPGDNTERERNQRLNENHNLEGHDFNGKAEQNNSEERLSPPNSIEVEMYEEDSRRYQGNDGMDAESQEKTKKRIHPIITL